MKDKYVTILIRQKKSEKTKMGQLLNTLKKPHKINVLDENHFVQHFS